MKINLFKINWTLKDIEAISDIIKRGMYYSGGKEIEELEKSISDYVKIRYVTTWNSGTSALHAMLLAHGIKEGDEVIVPSFTFIATANSVLMTRAKPIFADIEDKTYALDIESVKEKITPKTKAIMPIHYGGHPALYTRELRELVDDHNLFLFEDAAQAFGANIEGKCVGRFGNCGMFSMCQDKILTTGEGGILVTEDKEIHRKLKLIRSHGRDENMEYVTLGYNYRMPTILATLGLSQMKRVHNNIGKRRLLSQEYVGRLRKIKEVKYQNVLSTFFNVYQKFPIEVAEEDRDVLKWYLERNEIGTKADFYPIHLTPFYKNLGYEDNLPETERISKRILDLPIYPDLRVHEIHMVCDKIREFYE